MVVIVWGLAQRVHGAFMKDIGMLLALSFLPLSLGGGFEVPLLASLLLKNQFFWLSTHYPPQIQLAAGVPAPLWPDGIKNGNMGSMYTTTSDPQAPVSCANYGKSKTEYAKLTVCLGCKMAKKYYKLRIGRITKRGARTNRCSGSPKKEKITKYTFRCYLFPTIGA
jgi:hypothetical protein